MIFKYNNNKYLNIFDNGSIENNNNNTNRLNTSNSNKNIITTNRFYHNIEEFEK